MAHDQAQAQFESIVAMLAAVDVDYDRLDELREMKNSAADDGELMDADDVQELAELENAAGDCADQDDAQQRIYDDPLEVQVRSDWTDPGETLTPSEFCILLCTGGPAVRIVGELSEQGEPTRAWLEYQDWETPWTQFYGADSDTLVRYASNFFAG